MCGFLPHWYSDIHARLFLACRTISGKKYWLLGFASDPRLGLGFGLVLRMVNSLAASRGFFTGRFCDIRNKSSSSILEESHGGVRIYVGRVAYFEVLLDRWGSESLLNSSASACCGCACMVLNVVCRVWCVAWLSQCLGWVGSRFRFLEFGFGLLGLRCRTLSGVWWSVYRSEVCFWGWVCCLFSWWGIAEKFFGWILIL